MTDYIYKIFRTPEWDALQSTGDFSGSVHDQRDGFIHFSTAPQLAGTLAKHYISGDNLILAQVTGREFRCCVEI